MTIPKDAERLLKSVGLDEVAEIYRSEILIDDYLMRQNNPNDRWDSRRFLIEFAQRIRNAALEEAAKEVETKTVPLGYERRYFAKAIRALKE